MKLFILFSGLLTAVLAQQRTEAEWVTLVQQINATAATLRTNLNEFDEYALPAIKLYDEFQRFHLDLMQHPSLKLIKASSNQARDNKSEEYCKTLANDKVVEFINNLKKETSKLQQFVDFYRSSFPIINGVVKEIEEFPIIEIQAQIDDYCNYYPDLPECWINHAPHILDIANHNFTVAADKLIELHRELPRTLGKLLLNNNIALNFKYEVLKPVRDCWVDNFPLNRLIENFQSIMSLSVL